MTVLCSLCTTTVVQHQQVGCKRCHFMSKERGNLADRSPVAASQPLKRVQRKQRETYDQPAILLMYRLLLSELDTGSTVYPDDDQKIETDLILYDGVLDILCKFAYCMDVRVIFMVSDSTGSLQNGLQHVLDFFKSSAMALTWAFARDGLIEHTRIISSFVRIRIRLSQHCPLL